MEMIAVVMVRGNNFTTIYNNYHNMDIGLFIAKNGLRQIMQ